MKNLLIGAAVVASVIFFVNDKKTLTSTNSPHSALYSPSSTVQEVDVQKELPDSETVSPGLYYAGDPCTSDCSGHEAGATWAEENQIEDPEHCGGNSDSFIEGCRTFVEKKLEEEEPLDGSEDL
ncbi:hypothetical protein [Massilia sp. Leaf139]|uniref:hypothetical protein n=1 Tax=Massilia sp. Leaf139 TaxID=1736272 RepID=UPI0012E87675|nr:hypothetical protein [Massilia sp. Leaf139]